MPVSFDQVAVGHKYTRQQLADLWGYDSYQAIARGAVTPRNTPYIILFITQEQQASLTQYRNKLDKGILYIEGETNHGGDKRFINAERMNDHIHLFYREHHHSAFTYYGQIHLINSELRMNAPSLFQFSVLSEQTNDSLETEFITHGIINEDFIPDPEGRRAVHQHVTYERSQRNRAKALEIHGNKCMACEFDFDDTYGHDHSRGYIEIHHVQSITQINGPVCPETDLIPLCSNCHSMAHRKKGTILSLKELRELINRKFKPI